MNLLESAGFSRANPYYVVQQGKVLMFARTTSQCIHHTTTAHSCRNIQHFLPHADMRKSWQHVPA